jgi:hypothetical protein
MPCQLTCNQLYRNDRGANRHWRPAGRDTAYTLPALLRELAPFQRAFRQCVGNPEAICGLYAKVRQQSDGNYAFAGLLPGPAKAH